MAIEITVPTLGESVADATVARWIKTTGDAVAADEPVVELETDKVTLEVPAPAAGTVMGSAPRARPSRSAMSRASSLSRRCSGTHASQVREPLTSGTCATAQRTRRSSAATVSTCPPP